MRICVSFKIAFAYLLQICIAGIGPDNFCYPVSQSPFTAACA